MHIQFYLYKYEADRHKTRKRMFVSFCQIADCVRQKRQQYVCLCLFWNFADQYILYLPRVPGPPFYVTDSVVP